MYDVIIIGAGVSGSSAARELSRYKAKICVLEKAEDVCCGTSKANSAIVHAGYDAANGSLMAKLNVQGNQMMEDLSKELDFSFNRCGSLVVCIDEDSLPDLKALYERGVKNGVKDMQLILDREEIFRTQLRAVLRASVFGQVKIMFPMIVNLEELLQAKTLLARAMEELDQRGEAYNREIPVGIMIETPAAVMIADELAAEVDFFSLGTNDLSQYTLAIDRQNPKLDNFYDPHHPAILRMIKHTVQAGHRHGCWVGICGELGADQKLTETFLRMGVDELSVSPSAVLPLRKLIRSLDLSQE